MKLLITHMQLEHRLSALLKLHLHSRLNIWLQGIRQRQPQDSARIFLVLGFGAAYIRNLTAIMQRGDVSEASLIRASLSRLLLYSPGMSSIAWDCQDLDGLGKARCLLPDTQWQKAICGDKKYINNLKRDLNRVSILKAVSQLIEMLAMKIRRIWDRVVGNIEHRSF